MAQSGLEASLSLVKRDYILAAGMSIESEQTNGAVQESAANPDFNKKHPLERRWTLWYDSKAKKSQASWTEALKPVCTVSTVEEFWWCAPCLRIPKPPVLSRGA